LFIETVPHRLVQDGPFSEWCTKETSMNKFVARFAQNESGATAIEYGLIAAFIGIMLAAAMPLLKDALKAVFDAITAALNTGAG
jgi:pilus assembly protein Flp/PilA